MSWATSLKRFGCASSGACSWKQEKALTLPAVYAHVGWQRNPASALLLKKLFQNTGFMPVQRRSTKHRRCRGCLLPLEEPGTLTSLPSLPERGPNWSATDKRHRLDPSLHSQQHGLTISMSSRVGLRLTMPPAASRTRQEIYITLISKNLRWVCVIWS